MPQNSRNLEVSKFLCLYKTRETIWGIPQRTGLLRKSRFQASFRSQASLLMKRALKHRRQQVKKLFIYSQIKFMKWNLLFWELRENFDNSARSSQKQKFRMLSKNSPQKSNWSTSLAVTRDNSLPITPSCSSSKTTQQMPSFSLESSTTPFIEFNFQLKLFR